MSDPTRKTRTIVFDRDKGSCVRCGGQDVPLQCHHRRARGAGGSTAPDTNLPSNLITLCALWCHPQVESRRDQARADGYLVRQGQDPSTVPVRWHGEWVLLHQDGTVEAPEEDGMSADYETAVESLIDLLWDGTPDCMGGTPDLFWPQCRVHSHCPTPWGCWEEQIKARVAAVRMAAVKPKGDAR